MPKVAVTTSTFAKFDQSPLELLKGSGYQVVLNCFGRRIEQKELISLVKDAIGMIAGTESLDQTTLAQLPGLKVISRCGSGLDNVDLQAAMRLGIKVYNTADAPTVAVAELTVGLILSLLRKIPFLGQKMRKGVWQKQMGSLLSGRQIGIVGLGRIGRKVAELLKSFGAEISYVDPQVDSAEFIKITLAELLGNSDIISLHLSFTKENYRLLGEKEFSLFKPGSYLINCSRGGIVDEDALYQALKQGRLSGAAIDVFEQEPYNGPLKKLDNVILTPHIGSYAKEARAQMELEAAENLIQGLGGQVD